MTMDPTAEIAMLQTLLTQSVEHAAHLQKERDHYKKLAGDRSNFATELLRQRNQYVHELRTLKHETQAVVHYFTQFLIKSKTCAMHKMTIESSESLLKSFAALYLTKR